MFFARGWFACYFSVSFFPSAPKYPVRRCLGTQNPFQNHLQKGLEHKGFVAGNNANGTFKKDSHSEWLERTL